MSRVSASREEAVKRATAALDLLGQAGTATAVAQQLELDIRFSLSKFVHTGSSYKKQNTARIQALMAGNKSLRVEYLGVYATMVVPKVFALFGAHPKMWDAGVVATQDTVLAGFRLWISKTTPLCAKAVEEAVGARKECIRMAYELVHAGVCWMPARSTDEMAEMHQQYLDAQWGKDGSVLTTACMGYRFDRHHTIAQGLPLGCDIMLMYIYPQGAAEHCGDVQQMAQLFEKQLGGLREFVKGGASGIELPWFMFYGLPAFGLELNVLHPFGKEVAALLEACEGQFTDPDGCEECYQTTEWKAYAAKNGEGVSSKDGLHHVSSKPTVISALQALLSLSLASTGTTNSNLSWLDNLPSADNPKLHDCFLIAAGGFASTLTLIAEVFEWQGRHKEAIRCASSQTLLMTVC
jgi:hypothetical protein